MRALGYLSLLSRVREISDTRHTRPDGDARPRARRAARPRAPARGGVDRDRTKIKKKLLRECCVCGRRPRGEGAVHAWVGQIVTFFATPPPAGPWAP